MENFLTKINYQVKLKYIKENPQMTREFTPAELANSAFNFSMAEQTLSANELVLVLSIYNFYAGSQVKLNLNFEQWRKYINDIMASYDLVAPFYKFSGFEEEPDVLFFEVKKIPYRERAKKIINDGEFITTKWSNLVEEFLQKFGEYI